MQQINMEQIALFSLILMRMSGFIFLNPIFRQRSIPGLAKAGMAMVLAFLIYPTAEGLVIDTSLPLVFGMSLIKEFFVGWLMGFIMELFAFVLTYAGAIIDFQMGLSMAMIYDAQSGAQVALTGTLLNTFYVLLFFAVDGHLALMKIIVTAADVIPYGTAAIGTEAAQAVLLIFQECVVMAVKLTFPFIAVEFVSQVGVGILMKMIPQINLFVMSIQFRLIVGFLVFLFLISPMSDYVGGLITDMLNAIQRTLPALTGGG